MYSFIYAQINNPAISSNLVGLNGAEFMQSLLKGAISSALVLGGLVFTFMIIVGGIKYITSAGDKAQTESARKTITNALIGIVIVFALFAIIKIVGCFFGMDLLYIRVGEFDVTFGSCETPYGEPRDPDNPGPR